MNQRMFVLHGGTAIEVPLWKDIYEYPIGTYVFVADSMHQYYLTMRIDKEYAEDVVKVSSNGVPKEFKMWLLLLGVEG